MRAMALHYERLESRAALDRRRREREEHAAPLPAATVPSIPAADGSDRPRERRDGGTRRTMSRAGPDETTLALLNLMP